MIVMLNCNLYLFSGVLLFANISKSVQIFFTWSSKAEKLKAYIQVTHYAFADMLYTSKIGAFIYISNKSLP